MIDKSYKIISIIIILLLIFFIIYFYGKNQGENEIQKEWDFEKL